MARRGAAKPPTPSTPSSKISLDSDKESINNDGNSLSANDTEDDGVCEECGGCFKDDSKSARSLNLVISLKDFGPASIVHN